MKIILKYILKTAIRDRFFLGIAFAMIFAFSISSMISYSTVSEQTQMQVVVFASSVRLILTCGMVLFICFHIHKSFDNKEIQFILAKNISRYKFIFSYWISFAIISLLLIIPLNIVILYFCEVNFNGAFQWITSIILEILIINTFAIISSLIIKSSVISVFGTIGFYIVSRLMGFFLQDIVFLNNGELAENVSNFSFISMEYISSIFPRLDLFGQTKWLIYGNDLKIFKIIVIQSIIYIPIMLLTAFYDFRKKEF